MGFMGFKKPLNYMQHFLSPLYFSKEGHPEFTTHSLKLCHTPPRHHQGMNKLHFTAVFHLWDMTQVLKIFLIYIHLEGLNTLTVMTQKQVSE